MKKVLVADDSLTIQKVISITLANERVELVQAKSYEELTSHLEKHSFNLILLDFNISDELDGYELINNVKNLAKESGILTMLGTFDSVDEEKAKNLGSDDIIVKPFESSRFINLFRELIEKYSKTDSLTQLSAKLDQSNDEDDPALDLDSWTTNAPKIQEDTAPVNDNNIGQEGRDLGLSSSLEDWGIQQSTEIQNPIYQSMELPPEIQSTAVKNKAPKPKQSLDVGEDLSLDRDEDEQSIETEDKILPSSNDLEYPDEISFEERSPGDLNLELDIPKETPKEDDLIFQLDEPSNDLSKKPSFIQFDDLSDQEEIDPMEFNEPTQEFDIGFNLRKDLQKEVESEIDPNKFWDSKSTEFESLDQNSLELEAPKTSSTGHEQPIIQELDEGEIEKKIEAVVRRIMEEKIEKVVWEVVPEIAERLIKSEIKNIAKEI